MPRWMRSQSPLSNSRNICLPTARASVITWPSSCPAPATNLPCGEETRDGFADEVAGELAGDAMNGMTLWHGQPTRPVPRMRAGRFVFGELRDPAGVALLAGKRCRDERVDEGRRVFDGVLPGPDRDDVGVVVLPGQPGRAEVPGQGSAGTLDLVGGDLLPVARAAEDDAERRDPVRLVVHHGLRGRDAERRVVIQLVVTGRPVIDDLMARGREVLHQVPAEVQARVVGGDVDAHSCSLFAGPVRGRSVGRPGRKSGHACGFRWSSKRSSNRASHHGERGRDDLVRSERRLWAPGRRPIRRRNNVLADHRLKSLACPKTIRECPCKRVATGRTQMTSTREAHIAY